MKYKMMINLRLFEDGGQGGDGGQGSAGAGGSGQRGSAGYTFEQAEEIANSRAEKASRAALADFYRKQGLSESEITTAIAEFKAKQAANKPNTDAMQREIEGYKQQIAQMENEKLLSTKGVKAEDMDYVLFKVNKLVDDKTDFKKAAEKFLKENQRFIGTSSYRISTGTGTQDTGSGGSMNSSINDAIRSAARR
ncbi:MAG: hypothetical protein MSR29_11290 [Lachnospiraceae bacterium]|nr:hypothetical protein [Lachnospiraceae bacterium]